MSDIQRWTPQWQAECLPDDDGLYVKHADHLAAVQQAVMQARADWEMSNGPAFDYEQGQRDALAAAVSRVEALRRPGDLGGPPSYFECIAAIKGGSDEA